jgi:transposase
MTDTDINAILSAREKRDADELLRLRETVTAMLARGDGEHALESLLKLIGDLQHDNQRLTYRLNAAALARFGRRSEKLTAEELGQLVLALGGTEAEATASEPVIPTPEVPTEEADSTEPPKDEKPGKGKGNRPTHHGRTKLDPTIPRDVTVVPVPGEERSCLHCQTEMTCIDYIDHETIEFIPGQIRVRVERREKLACRNCKQDMAVAPRDQSVPHQRRAGMSLLAHLLESKCDDALPIYRQHDQLARLGFHVPRNTLYGYWDCAASMLVPVAAAIISTILADPIVGIDDTKLDFLDRDDPRGRRRGHLWCFVGCTPLVGFCFTESWAADDIEPWISAIDGFIQCDDYKGYGTVVTFPDGRKQPLVPLDKRLGCMMHVRRRFFVAHKARYLDAAVPLKLIADIYEIEAKAKTAVLTPDQRLDLRQTKSIPLLDAFDLWVDETLPKLPPKNPLAAAARYAKDQRPFVRRCFTDGRFEIDNGRVEREVREPAIGRKNFLFAGSAVGAVRLAATYTVVQSARRSGINVRDYLVDVLGKLAHDWPARKLSELIPTRWTP